MSQPPQLHLVRDICTPQRGVDPHTLEQVLILAVEIAREGREGRKIGTLFVVGDHPAVLRHSRCLILDPLWHHPAARKRLEDPDARETIKELAQLDGAFVVAEDGHVVSACRHLNVGGTGIELPLGLGSRHVAAASITRQTNAVAVVVSETAIVRVFDDGKLIGEIIPELWLLRRYGLHLEHPYRTRRHQDIAVAAAPNQPGEPKRADAA